MAQKAVILSRVSTKDQEDGYSIDAQNHRLQIYCDRKDLSVLKIFELVESSTKGDRRQFMEIIEFIKKQREPIALVADKVDRVQRSFKEYPLLDDLVEKGKIELHFYTENTVIHKDSNSQDKFMWTVGVMMAKSYVDSLRDNVKRSIEQKIRLGEWISKAPVGFINVKDARNRGDVIVDVVRAPLVKKVFESYATGAYTLEEIRLKAKEWGLRNRIGKKDYLNKAQIHRLIRNPFYCGQMNVKGELYDHRYEPIVSRDLFDACQTVLKGWNKKPFQWAGKEYVFRGLLTCATSGRVITADTKKRTYANGNVGEWTYLRCPKPDNINKYMWVREEIALKQVEAALAKLVSPSDLLDTVLFYIQETGHVEREFLTRQIDELNKEHKVVQNRLEKLMDLLLDGVITREEYNTRKKPMRSRQASIEANITANRKADDGFKDALISLVSIASNSLDMFTGSTIPEKRAILSFVFANLSLKGDKLLYSFKKPFNGMANCSNIEHWRALVDSLRTDLEIRNIIENFNFSILRDHNLLK